MKQIIAFLLLQSLLFGGSVLPSGSAVRIAVIDTGILTAVIDAAHVAPGKNYAVPSDSTQDVIGHGTAIASLIVGCDSAGVAGVAPDAVLVPLVYQTKDADGNVVKADQTVVAQAIRDAVDEFDCRVINLSVGTTIGSDALRRAVAYAENQGAVVVSSVGNANETAPDAVYYPAAYDTVIGVGAVDKNLTVSSFSQRNESVMLAALGEDFYAASLRGRPLLAAGTSYATAFVSAAAARVLAENEALTPAAVRDILCRTAKDLASPGYDTQTGFGLLQIAPALALARSEQ